jgi:hypothetical protein
MVGIKPETRAPNPKNPDPNPYYPKPEKTGAKSGGNSQNPNYVRAIRVWASGTRKARLTRVCAKFYRNMLAQQPKSPLHRSTPLPTPTSTLTLGRPRPNPVLAVVPDLAAVIFSAGATTPRLIPARTISGRWPPPAVAADSLPQRPRERPRLRLLPSPRPRESPAISAHDPASDSDHHHPSPSTAHLPLIVLRSGRQCIWLSLG